MESQNYVSVIEPTKQIRFDIESAKELLTSLQKLLTPESMENATKLGLNQFRIGIKGKKIVSTGFIPKRKKKMQMFHNHTITNVDTNNFVNTTKVLN